MDWITRLIREESGNAVVEYGLLIVLILLMVAAAVGLLGSNISSTLQRVAAVVSPIV